MEMLQCRLILASLLVLNVGCFLEGSCQTVDTYTTKDAESLPCTMTEQTPTVIWAEIVVGDSITVLTYQSGNPPLISISTEEKYNNFNNTLEPTSFNLVILNVEDEDGGVYGCSPFGSNPTTYDITVEDAPVCNLNIQERETCMEVTLTCECDAVPAVISQYSFFNESILINDGTSNTFTVNVAYGTQYRFSCSATNVIDDGEKSDKKVHYCSKGPSTLGTGAIVGIIVGALAVVIVIVIVVIAVIMWKKGKCGSKSESSSETDGNSTAKHSDIYGDELPLEVDEIKTDGKKR